MFGWRVAGDVGVSYRCESLGSQGSIVPVKVNVHAEPMIQSTATLLPVLPRQNWIPSFCHESSVLFTDVKPVQSASFLCADEIE